MKAKQKYLESNRFQIEVNAYCG